MKQAEATANIRVEPEPVVEKREDEGAPVGPSDEEESALLGEETESDTASAKAVSPAEAPDGELPDLEDLVKRIPGETMKILDELFRAKFVRVQRVSDRNLKKK